ncbi:DUF3618 domain-containing protein [Mumia sp. zg.B53]|uniref:DUF3618 domain-containing protein n=1 Tax=unclassified Mumia TaxID=2621872 RepID=UPI001C6EFE8C|nr:MULTISPECIES: DUF3618 domain-containing protein [unclassified Mumia]MBW9207149.1 DUF3618 domain-containing protein [Mumia sp. zg.B17]MBW9210501.1 DUF3618 domain-containing protein [Mumia sp. zg.B21]MBW9215124.1 DUF3618 domain-containing protein [Mumia sp. zg.B53]MDD9350464.1 DUF3618 domain-containing protein [Mumia sp.]
MSTDPNDIQREIEETREDLGRTVEQLTDRLDVKKQAKARVDEVKSEVKSEAEQRLEYVKQNARDNPQLPAIIVGGVLLLIVARVWRKRRS